MVWTSIARKSPIESYETNHILAVYKHFRELGWVVKLGSKVGVDFLLYTLGGPQHAHAQYGVSIRSNTFVHADAHEIPWSASSRVLDSVAKSLLIAIVTSTGDISSEGQEDVNFDFPGWSLHFLVLSRWQSTLLTKTS
jgi:tRNA-intron lyase